MTDLIGGNAFVAAFIAGSAFAGAAAWTHQDKTALALTETLSEPLGFAVWFAFGLAALPLIGSALGWPEVAFAAVGVLRLGSLVRFVPNAVLTGFVNAVAVNIVLGQLTNFTGYAGQGPNRIARTVDTFLHITSFHGQTVAVGVDVMVGFLFGLGVVASAGYPRGRAPAEMPRSGCPRSSRRGPTRAWSVVSCTDALHGGRAFSAEYGVGMCRRGGAAPRCRRPPDARAG